MTDPITLITPQSDKELAADFRKRMEAALLVVCDIMREADQAGLQIDFSISRDQYARRVIGGISVARPL